MNLILASASPRRRDLLQEAGIPFRVVPAAVPEELLPGERPAAHVRRLARAKAAAVAGAFPDSVVLGADTSVVLGSNVFGKPGDVGQAREMLAALSGAVHDVLTGVCLRRLQPGAEDSWVCRTRVRFRTLTPATIERYFSLVDPLDKAGAYAIQEHGDMLISDIDGLRSNVIGLPIEQVRERLGQGPWAG